MKNRFQIQRNFKLLICFTFIIIYGCQNKHYSESGTEDNEREGVYLYVLGNVQDAGSPHAACQKNCCKDRYLKRSDEYLVCSLGLIDYDEQKSILFEATPDFPIQLHKIGKLHQFDNKNVLDAIFLTHAHIGHYSGLMYLGRESMNSKNIPVFAMPRMTKFLQNNGPWSQLVKLSNVNLKPLMHNRPINISTSIQITPFIVPHRDEFSETVGFLIKGPSKKALFIPDIDKWSKWSTPIDSLIQKVDYAFLDATFFDGEELKIRDLNEIPHPFVRESMQDFSKLPMNERQKVFFIHFNHTNPLLDKKSKESKTVLKKGFQIARSDMSFKL